MVRVCGLERRPGKLNRKQTPAKKRYQNAFLVLSLVLIVYSGVQWLRGIEPLLSWLGLILAAGAPAFFLVLRRMQPAGGNPQFSVATGAICGLGLAITMAMNWRYGDASGVVHLWAGACLIAWLVNLRWAER